MAVEHRSEYFKDGDRHDAARHLGDIDTRQQINRLYDHLSRIPLNYDDKDAFRTWGSGMSNSISMFHIHRYLEKKNPGKKYPELDHAKEPAMKLNQALSKSPGLPETVHTYHGTGVILGRKLRNAEVGQRIFVPAPIATSLRHATAMQFVKSDPVTTRDGSAWTPSTTTTNQNFSYHAKTIAHFHLPKGYNGGMFVGHLTGHSSENELTMKPGQHFLITKKEHFTGKCEFTRSPHLVTVTSLVPVLSPTNAATHVSASPNQIDNQSQAFGNQE